MSDAERVVRYPIPAALAALDGRRHLVVEASAGTGKTFFIEHRVVDLLVRGEATIDQILVVTFTEKATAELRARIRQLIEKVATATAAPTSLAEDAAAWRIGPGERRLLVDALAGFDRAQISTIHAFCQRVLTDNAFAGRRLLRQTRVEGEPAFAAAFMATLRGRLARDPDDRALLVEWLAAGKPIGALEALLRKCAPDAARLVPQLDPAALIAAADGLARVLPGLDPPDLVERALRQAGVAPRSMPVAMRALHGLAAAVRGGDRPAPADASPRARAARLIGALDRGKLHDDVAKLRGYLATAAAKSPAMFAPLAAAVAALEAKTVPLAAAIVCAFLPAVLAQLEERKLLAGEFDFDDMMRLVWAALTGPDGEALATRLRQRHRFAIIDEFQDTDDVQWAIFQRLYLGDDETATPPDCRLTVVGDPKQAIYGFRGADVHTYLTARDEIVRQGGQRLALTENFRCSPAMVAVHNLLFCYGYFSGDIEHPEARAGASLEAVDASGAPLPPVVVHRLADGSSDERVRAQRDRITRELRRLLADGGTALQIRRGGTLTPLRARDIFILTRSLRESDDIAAALRAAGVPCAIHQQEGLFETREAAEIVDLLAAIAAPRDRSARLRAWATRFFAVPLAELPRLVDLPDTHPLQARLHEWRELADRLDYEALFPRILADTRFVETELLTQPSERALTNVLHLFEVLLAEVVRSRCDIAELTTRLRHWIAAGRDASAEERDVQRLESERDAVQIMSMHRAKGLQAPVVFLYGSLGGAQSGSKGEVGVHHDSGGRRVWVGGQRPDDVRSRVGDELEGDTQRLLYVAATRAQVRLYVPLGVGKATATNALTRAVAARVGPSKPEVARLFEEVELRAATGRRDPAVAQDLAAALATWTPPATLVPEAAHAFAPAADAGYRAIAVARAGVAITSYTRLKHEGAAIASRRPVERADFDAGPPSEMPDDGDLATASATAPVSASAAVAAAASATTATVGPAPPPPGAASGIFLHDLLEHVDLAGVRDADDATSWAARPEVARLLLRIAARHGIDPSFLPASAAMVWQALRTPLAPRLPLACLAAAPRIERELEFLYSVAGSAGRGTFIKGFFDLLVEDDDGRLWVVDYKSDSLPAWDEPTVAAAVAREYQLQVELYALALERIAGARRVGGLFFWFLRGGAGCVIRPDTDDLRRWATALAAREVRP